MYASCPRKTRRVKLSAILREKERAMYVRKEIEQPSCGPGDRFSLPWWLCGYFHRTYSSIPDEIPQREDRGWVDRLTLVFATPVYRCVLKPSQIDKQHGDRSREFRGEDWREISDDCSTAAPSHCLLGWGMVQKWCLGSNARSSSAPRAQHDPTSTAGRTHHSLVGGSIAPKLPCVSVAISGSQRHYNPFRTAFPFWGKTACV